MRGEIEVGGVGHGCVRGRSTPGVAWSGGGRVQGRGGEDGGGAGEDGEEDWAG